MTKVKEKRLKRIDRPTVKEYVKERIKDIPLTIMMAAFIAFCLASIIYFICIGRYRDIAIGFAYMAIVFVIYFAEYTLNVRAPYGYIVFTLLFVLFCFLGASYNLYYTIPHLDDILHAAWGVVFSVVGIILIKGLIGTPKTPKAVIAYVLFGVGFAMLLSVVWEIYEYSGDRLIPDMDMQQDDIVDHIHSFMMYPDPSNPSPDNLHTWKVENIVKTIIIDANGNEYVIPNGYLDLGLTDTMHDIIFCFATTAVFSIILAIDWCKGKYFYRFIIPQLVGEKYDRKGKMIERVTAADGAPAGEEVVDSVTSAGGATAAEEEVAATQEISETGEQPEEQTEEN